MKLRWIRNVKARWNNSHSKGQPVIVKHAFCILLGCIFLHSTHAQQKKPNIIFILTDDQGYGDLGAFFQNERAKSGDRSKPVELTPNLDQLAASGAMLMQDYSSAPVCAPSRASLMLGVSQGHSNVRDNQFDKALEDNYTMPSTLRTLGYTTLAIGKWGLQGSDKFDKDGASWPAKPRNRGFDHFFGYMRHVDGHEHYPKEALYYKKDQVEVWKDGTNITPSLDKVYTADLWTAYAKHWITNYEQNKTGGKPFFIFLAYETPHAVLELPTQPYPKGGGLKGGLQWLGEEGHMINTASGKVDSWINPEYATATYDDDQDPNTQEKPWPETYKRYAMANRRVDDGVGDIVQLLKDLHIDENTIIVYTSDNGPSIESYLPKEYVPNHPTFFGSYGPFDGIKRDTWEGGMRMPTIANWPGHIPAGKKINLPTISYDWATTFTNIAGSPAPAKMDGVSLLPILTGKAGSLNKEEKAILTKPIYTEYYEGGRTPEFEDFAPGHRGRRRNQMQWIRIGDYVGVRYDIQSADDRFEIYNVAKDPGQRNNLQLDSLQSVSVALEGKSQEMEVRDLQQLMKSQVLQMRVANTSAPRPYDSAAIPAVSSKKKLQKGIHWAFYPGEFSWLPQVAGMHPNKQGVLPSLSFSGSSQSLATEKHAGLLYYEGYIHVPATGHYTFYLKPGSKALLKLHEAVVIDADHNYKKDTTYSVSLHLKEGWHPVRLYAAKPANAGQPELSLQWEGSGLERQSMVFSHR